jgi:succinate dehydrogenase/fumarate reductase flavoprotein subunit
MDEQQSEAQGEVKLTDDYDVVVVGSGASGMAAAVTAKLHGLNVIVVEKESFYGGTTARAGGGLWIPNNSYAKKEGISDTWENASRYLRHSIGNRYDEKRVDAFLTSGPEMLDFFENNTELQFVVAPAYADYHPDWPGGIAGGRTVFPLPFDARPLGKELLKIAPPLKELTFLGMHIGSTRELVHFFNATRSIHSASVVARRLAQHAYDMLIYKHPTQLSNGAALIARLLKSAFDAGIPIWTSSPVIRLLKQANRVVGVIVRTPEGDIELRSRRGVVLACGGFPHDLKRRKQLYKHARNNGNHWSAGYEANTGDGLRMAEEVGADENTDVSNPAAWAPVSLVPRKEGFGVYPHFMDRQKPGRIVVTRNGKRFTNEANSYHDFIQELTAACEGEAETCAFLVTDHPSFRRYGLGAARPSPVPYGRHLRSGYIQRANTIAELAQKLGVSPGGLQQTVENFNVDARQGKDPEFGRGTTSYNLYFGDPSHRPNPCLGPIETGPFYGLKLVPGDIGTVAGLRTDEYARVLDKNHLPIPGLYAVGNDQASVFAGQYPGGGATLGPGMTFGYIAGRYLANGAPVAAKDAAIV